MRARLIVLVFVACVAMVGIRADRVQAPALDSVINALTFRNVGPFRTAAWVTEIAVPESPARDHLYTIYAATRSGGLWKTTNAGTTWRAISDSVGAAAVGAVAIAPSNPSVVWMGTGDQANARSSYSGKGVFKSTDAGATWQFMGLPDSHHIARIVIRYGFGETPTLEVKDGSSDEAAAKPAPAAIAAEGGTSLPQAASLTAPAIAR